MVAAQIVTVWQEEIRAYIAIRVTELDGATEYIGSVLLSDLAGNSRAEQKAKLTAAVKAVRDGQRKPRQDVAGITGSVTV